MYIRHPLLVRGVHRTSKPPVDTEAFPPRTNMPEDNTSSPRCVRTAETPAVSSPEVPQVRLHDYMLTVAFFGAEAAGPGEDVAESERGEQ